MTPDTFSRTSKIRQRSRWRGARKQSKTCVRGQTGGGATRSGGPRPEGKGRCCPEHRASQAAACLPRLPAGLSTLWLDAGLWAAQRHGGCLVGCLVGRDRAQRACVYRTWDGVVLIHTSPFSKYFGGVYSVPGTAPLVQTLTSSKALQGRANKCASPEQLMGCLGARSPAAEARCWAGG